ncbi:MAG: phosphatase PAP2 family protein [Dehalococcoidales bacterium]|nr:phosphatase PAP2 family protein [Dehalococcoidales bacterium]
MRINNKFLIILLILLTSTITMSVFACYNDRFPGDLWLTQGIQSISSDSLSSLMQGISTLLDSWISYILVAAIALLVWWRTGWREAVLVLAGAILAATSAVFKAIIDRPRPSPDLVTVFSQADTGSFPSGHSFFTFIVFGLVAYLAATRLQNNILRTSVLIVATVLILLVGISRIYLGAHWPSDVLGGYLAGGVFLTALIWIDRIWMSRHNDIKEKTLPEHDSDKV